MRNEYDPLAPLYLVLYVAFVAVMLYGFICYEGPPLHIKSDPPVDRDVG